MATDLGAVVTLSTGQARLDRVLFAEGGHRIIVSVKAECLADWEQLIASCSDLSVTPIGAVVEQKRLQIQSETGMHLDLELAACRSAFSEALPRRIEAD